VCIAVALQIDAAAAAAAAADGSCLMQLAANIASSSCKDQPMYFELLDRSGQSHWYGDKVQSTGHLLLAETARNTVIGYKSWHHTSWPTSCLFP
jgi:hypothetical protein